MTDDEVLDYTRADGFELIERMSAGQWAVGWARGDDERWPCFLTEFQGTWTTRSPNRSGHRSSVRSCTDTGSLTGLAPVGRSSRGSTDTTTIGCTQALATCRPSNGNSSTVNNQADKAA
jgi:hypothetical protein